MSITPKKRTEKILRICARLPKGESLAAACEAEKTRVTTFIAWMRKYGPTGKGGEGYPRSIKRMAVLDSDRDRITLGGVGTSFNATVRARLCASFDPKEGVEIWMVSTSPLAQLSDRGRRLVEPVASGIRSIEEAEDAISGVETEFRMSFCDSTAIDRLEQAFPWLPKSLDGPGEEAPQ